MTALADIRTAIDRTIRLVEREVGQPLSPAAKRFARNQRLLIKLGGSAAQAIVAELAVARKNAAVPSEIDDVPVERTEDFAGFEVVVL